jgi:3-hydroxyacyl-CoA dehydrogenase
VGLDVISYVHDELGDPYYAPPSLLKELVCAGRPRPEDQTGLLRVLRRTLRRDCSVRFRTP